MYLCTNSKALGVYETLSDLFFINDYAALRVYVIRGWYNFDSYT